MGREERLEEIREHMEKNMKHLMMGQEDQCIRADIWQIKGYCSTDCGEENDEKEGDTMQKAGGQYDSLAAGDGADEDEEYYDYYDEEEDDGAENVPDLMVVGTGISSTTQLI